MDKIAPPNRPNFDRSWLFKQMFEKIPYLIKTLKGEELFLIGIRGYYLNTMGKKNENDFDLYDDAIALVSTRKIWTFNCSMDPQVVKNHVAQLPDGVIWYKQGQHGISGDNPYDALRQAKPVRVRRYNDKTGEWFLDDLGWPFTNIHKGGWTRTGSLGCITIYPSQWDEFINLVYKEMDALNKELIPCLIMETQG